MSLPVAPLAADDCAVLLWCTWPHIAIGTHIEVIKAWGFRPSTAAFVWVKERVGDEHHTGMGYWTRSNTEVVIAPPRALRCASRATCIKW